MRMMIVLVVVGVVLRDHNATKTSRLLRLPFRSTFRMSILQRRRRRRRRSYSRWCCWWWCRYRKHDDEDDDLRVYVCVFLCFSTRRYNGEFDTFSPHNYSYNLKSARQRDFRGEKRDATRAILCAGATEQWYVPFLNESRRRASVKGGRTNPNRHHLGKGNEKQFR